MNSEQMRCSIRVAAACVETARQLAPNLKSYDMITIHALNNSRATRILWLLEELELPYEVQRYERNPKTMLAPASLKQVHPLGKSPLLTDGEHTLAESGAIIEYVLDRYGEGRLRPASDSEEFLRYRHFLHYAEGSLMPLMLLALVFGRMPKEPMPFFVRPIARQISKQGMRRFIGPQIDLHLSYLENELTGPWLLGDMLTGADMQLSFPLEAAAVRADLSDRYPRLGAYLKRIQQHPAYLRALQKGGPLNLG